MNIKYEILASVVNGMEHRPLKSDFDKSCAHRKALRRRHFVAPQSLSSLIEREVLNGNKEHDTWNHSEGLSTNSLR